jgi:hypothetical protein
VTQQGQGTRAVIRQAKRQLHPANFRASALTYLFLSLPR